MNRTCRPPRALLLPLLPLLLATGCTKEGTQDEERLQPVVESYLLPGRPVRVKITEEVPYSESGGLTPLNGLLVLIEHQGTLDTLQGAGDGWYEGSASLPIEAGASYALRFSHQGSEVSATTTVPPAPSGLSMSANTLEIPEMDFGDSPPTTLPEFPDPITLEWNNPDLAYHLVVVQNIEEDPVRIGSSDAPERPSFRTEPTTVNTADLNFGSFSYFGTHRIILYRLNADYASLYLDNGTNSQDLATPQSNIVNGLGIFTGINSDTLLLEVVEQ